MKKLIYGIIIVLVVALVYIILRGDEGERTPTSADNAPPGSIHNLPVPEAVSNVRAQVAEEFDTEEGLVIVQSALEKEWPNACLGLEDEGEMCAQVITPGYEVVLEVEGEIVTYRTNSDGAVIREE